MVVWYAATGLLILDQIPLMMVSVVQFSTENFWFRFVSGLVAVGLGAYFVYLFVAFEKEKLITWTFRNQRNLASGLVRFGDNLLCEYLVISYYVWKD